MENEAEKLFNLIDMAYSEDLTNQPAKYKLCLLKRAQELSSGVDTLTVCAGLFKDYRTNYMVPMTFPPKNRLLYSYVRNNLKQLNQKQLRDLNLGYGLIATHFTFGPFN